MTLKKTNTPIGQEKYTTNCPNNGSNLI